MSILDFILLSLLLTFCFGYELELQEPVGQENSNLAVVDDFKYLLDIVDCPRAIPFDQKLTTYKTIIYNRFLNRILAPTCCSWRMSRYDTEYTLSEDNTIEIETDGQIRGAIQHFKLSCPYGGQIKQDTFKVDLLPPVKFRGTMFCADSVSLVFDNDNSYSCQFCGNKYAADSSSCVLSRFQSELLVTFRSGYRPTKSDYTGFKATVKCFTGIQEQGECLRYDPKLASEKYLDNLIIRQSSQTRDFLHDLEDLNLNKIPEDAKEILLDFYHNDRKSSLPNERILKILNLAILCEQSCDDGLSTLSKDIQGSFPEETLVQAAIYILDM